MGRLTIRGIWDMMVDDIFDLDKGLVYTAKELWINPGRTALNFINGRTKKYYSPLKYLVFWTALYFILLSFADIDRPSTSIRALIFRTSPPFSGESIQDYMVIYGEMLFRHTDLFYLGLTPFLTMTSYFIYKKKNFFFAELSVLYLYILGQIISLIALLLPVLSSLGDNKIALVFMIPLAMVVVYLIIKSHKQFFGESWTKSTVKGLVILYIGQLLYWLTTYTVLNLIKASQ